MIKRPYIRQGSTPFQELKKAAKSWPGLETFLNNLTNDGTDSEQGARRANFVQLRNEIDDAAHDIYDRLDHYKKRALSEEGNLVYPGLMRYQNAPIILLIHFRSSGDPCSPLHILAINPTFSVDVHSPYGILDPKCPSMGEVVQSGLTSEKCFGTDLFPLRVNIDYLEVTDRPFDGFPEFTDLFLHRHLSSFLEIGGKVLLVFGRSCFKALEDHLKLKSIELDGSNDGLRIYWEEVLIKQNQRSGLIFI